MYNWFKTTRKDINIKSLGNQKTETISKKCDFVFIGPAEFNKAIILEY